MLNKLEKEKLLHDIKRAGKVIQLIINEDVKEKRKLIGELLVAEYDRFYEDVEELTENGD